MSKRGATTRLPGIERIVDQHAYALDVDLQGSEGVSSLSLCVRLLSSLDEEVQEAASD